jgi:hypothetical protein
MRRAIIPLTLLAGCATPTMAEYLARQEGFVAHSGHVLRVTIPNPAVTKLKNGTAYTATAAGGTVVIYNETRDSSGKRRNERTFDLRPGDQFINAQPLSYVLIQK